MCADLKQGFFSKPFFVLLLMWKDGKVTGKVFRGYYDTTLTVLEL